jgi:hypothetical protein
LAGSSSAELPETRQRGLNRDNFQITVREFKTFEEAKAWAPTIKIPIVDPEDQSFYLSTTHKLKRLSYDEVVDFQDYIVEGAKNLNIGQMCHRLRVGYKIMTDATSAVFSVQRIKRIV